jgi:tetratricopeptide (TPR) repeat protein
MSDVKAPTIRPARPRAGEVRGLTRPYYVAVALIVGVGLGLAYLLLPREQELAFMQMKNEDYHAARDAYESQLDAVNPSAGVIVPLASIYEHFGNIDGAIALFERYVAKHPDNVDAWRRLARYYDDSHNPARRRAALEEVDRQAPTADNLRDLIEIYRSSGDNAAFAQALSRLVNRFAATSDEVTDHATILASQGRLSEAVDALSSFEATSRQLFDDNAAILLAALRLDLRLNDEAVQGAHGYLRGRGTADSIGALAFLFRNKSRSDLALNLIEPYGSIMDGSPALLELAIDLERSAGLAGKAHARLERLEAEGNLPGALYTRAMLISLSNSAM